jgi:phage major head subunit gpT-like protein
MARAGLRDDKGVAIRVDASNPFRGHKLLDIARASLERGGVKVAGMTQMEVVAAAFTQSTSDFPILLENTMHKALQNAYAVAALTWSRFCATGSVSDFRAHNRYRVGSLGNLDAVNELGEFKSKAIPDGEKGSITASTKGNIINLSRQAIVNDDLGAFVGLSGMLGRAAARTVEADVYALLALNAGLGPTMGDSKTLFHSDHKNIGSTAAIAMASLDADRVLMASQLDVSGNDYLDLRPSVLVVSTGLEGSAKAINAASYDPDTANKLQKPNIVQGLFSDIVGTPRLGSSTRRYLFADPMEAPVLEVAFLDGNQAPDLEVQNGFDVDGARYKVRLDYGVAAVDFRGAVTNAG